MASKSTPESFSAVKRVCKFLGVYFYDKDSSFNNLTIFINTVLFIFQFALVLSCLAYFLRYSSDVNDAAEVLSFLFPSILHLGQYCILVFTKPQLIVLFNNFEELIELSV